MSQLDAIILGLLLDIPTQRNKGAGEGQMIYILCSISYILMYFLIYWLILRISIISNFQIVQICFPRCEK